MRLLEFPDGKHWPNLRTLWNGLRINRSKGHLLVLANNASKYEQTIDPREQGDWLKLIGRGGLMMTKGPEGYWVRKSEFFIVWRYRPELNTFQFAYYERKNGVRQPVEPIGEIKNQGTLIISLRQLKGKGIIRLLPYFGGTSPEPKDGKSTKLWVRHMKKLKP